MKIKITLTTLSAIIALAMITMNAYSQNHAFSGVQNMGATLNSADNEQHMALSPNGLSLYFTNNRTGGQGGQDIWVSQRNALNSAWGVPQNLGATVNTSSNDSAPTFSLDGRTIFFFSNRAGAGGNDIYISTRTDANDDFDWTAPVNLGAVINTASSEVNPEYFEDPTNGNGTLIFASDRAGQGFNDLYQSTRNADGTFNSPTPISELNGPGPETAAAIRRDGLEIIFSTGRTPSQTPHLDLYISTRASVSAKWDTPVLLAGGVNTAANENSPHLSPDGAVLYFNRTIVGGAGTGLDLYSSTRCSLYLTTCQNPDSTADFDGDGITDLSVFRPSDGTWHILNSGSNTYRVQPFGLNGDKITPGDYDGDGRTDFAVFRPSTATWWIMKSSDNSFSTTQWGLATDNPVPADYDGDGKTDIGVYRDGTWYIIQSTTDDPAYHNFGLSGDIPVSVANGQ